MPDDGAAPAMRYAGWGRRVGAVVIDGLLSIVFVIPAIVALAVGPTEIDTCTIDGERRLCEVPTGGTIGFGVLLYVVGIAVFIALYCRRVGRSGQSWGMGAAGYKIVDERTGNVIGTGRAVGRYFARILSALPCYLGFLWPLWDGENRTFHDMIVRTRAVLA
jgi:uncharacterized RDD family membrane protein YckC